MCTSSSTKWRGSGLRITGPGAPIRTDRRTAIGLGAATVLASGLASGLQATPAPAGHKGSRNQLLGKDQTPERISRWSARTGVTAATPPTFLAHGADDTDVPCDNSLMFQAALRAHKVPSELHIFEAGGHGFALAGTGRRRPGPTCSSPGRVATA